MGRKVKRDVFDDLIMGLAGKDALYSLDKLNEIQNLMITGLTAEKLLKTQNEIQNYPLRYRIISKGFFDGVNLETLNQRLEEKGERRLYSRDLIEATLIFAFKKELKFEAWRKLVSKLKSLESEGIWDEFLIGGANGSYTAFPLEKIKLYVKKSSFEYAQTEFTIERTKTALQKLTGLETDDEFVAYICENIRNFCEGREKARYYICKYLCLYISTQVEYYLSKGISRNTKRNIYLDLPLSSISEMDPNRHANLSREETIACLKKAKLSPNKLFEIINRFYCYALLTDSEANDPNWEEYSLMRKILSGDGISRNMLQLCVLFFGCNSQIADEGMRLDVTRMNDILRACRFETLDEKSRKIDYIITKALVSDDPRAVLERLIYEDEDAVSKL